MMSSPTYLLLIYTPGVPWTWQLSRTDDMFLRVLGNTQGRIFSLYQSFPGPRNITFVLTSLVKLSDQQKVNLFSKYCFHFILSRLQENVDYQCFLFLHLGFSLVQVSWFFFLKKKFMFIKHISKAVAIILCILHSRIFNLKL